MIVEATMEDVLFVCKNMRQIDRKARQAMYGEVSDEWFAKHRFETAEVAMVMKENNVPIAVGGTQRWNNVITLWLIATPLWLRSWREAYRAMKKVLPVLWNDGILRVQAHVLGGFEEGCRLIEKLGFEREGVRRCLGINGEDVIEYSMVKYGR